MSTTPIPYKAAGDYLLAFTPLIAALAGFNWSGLIPGANGFLVGAFVGALAKLLTGFAQNPKLANWEDALGLAVLFLGFLGTAFTANPIFLTAGTVLGLLAKSLGFFQGGFNVEDAFLAIGALLAGYGALTGNVQLTNAGLLLGVVGKSLPSLVTGGLAGTPKPATPAAP